MLCAVMYIRLRLRLVKNSNRIQKEAEMLVVSHYIEKTLANAPNSRMCATDISSLINALLCNVDNGCLNFLRLDKKTVNYLLKTFATYQSITE